MPQIKLESRIQTGAHPFTASSAGESIGIAEYLGKSSTISLALHSPTRVSGRMTIGFLHSFNSAFCAGAELLTEWQHSALKYRLAMAARYACFHIPLLKKNFPFGAFSFAIELKLLPAFR